MDIKLHKLARTTPATRRSIQTSPKSAAALARELGVAVTTIYKWKRAGRIHDGSHPRHRLHASTSPEQEALIAELRTHLRVSLDDVTEVMNRGRPPRLSRSALPRCLVRLGVARLPSAAPDAPPVERFAAPPCGYIHRDLKVVSTLHKQPSYGLVAIDRATRYVWGKVLPRRTAATVPQAVEEVLAAFPHPVRTILTDNDGAFTDRLAGHKKHKPAGQPSGTHRLDRVCRAQGSTHRLIRSYHPQTKGMVERFNRRLSEALHSQPPLRPPCQNRFRSHAERTAFITRFVDNDNRTRLKCLNYQTPLQLLQNHTGQYRQPTMQDCSILTFPGRALLTTLCGMAVRIAWRRSAIPWP